MEKPPETVFDRGLPFGALETVKADDVTWDGRVILGKIENSGGELSVATCTQQLLYEIGDPARYITPDVVCV